MKLILKEVKQGGYSVIIDNINFGIFDDGINDHFSFFPRRTDLLTGDHLIAIGNALNQLNQKVFQIE